MLLAIAGTKLVNQASPLVLYYYISQILTRYYLYHLKKKNHRIHSHHFTNIRIMVML